MAGYKGHIIGGIVVGVAATSLAPLLPFEEAAEAAQFLEDWQALSGLFMICLLFALFPDVDTNSKAQDIFYGLAFILNLLLIYNGNFQAAAYLGLMAMLPVLGDHRGWTHSKWSMIIVPLPILLLPYIYNDNLLLPASLFYAAAVLGYFSHLLLDGLIIKQFRIKG